MILIIDFIKNVGYVNQKFVNLFCTIYKTVHISPLITTMQETNIFAGKA